MVMSVWNILHTQKELRAKGQTLTFGVMWYLTRDEQKKADKQLYLTG